MLRDRSQTVIRWPVTGLVTRLLAKHCIDIELMLALLSAIPVFGIDQRLGKGSLRTPVNLLCPRIGGDVLFLIASHRPHNGFTFVLRSIPFEIRLISRFYK